MNEDKISKPLEKWELWKRTEEFHNYIYFDNQYYIGQLYKLKEYNYKKQLAFRENAIELIAVEPFLTPALMDIFTRADTIETNIERRTRLFKNLKSDLSRLKYRFSNEKATDYQNLIGTIQTTNVVVIKGTLEIIKRKMLNVNSQADLYPPELICLAQLVRRVERTPIKAKELANISALAYQQETP